MHPFFRVLNYSNVTNVTIFITSPFGRDELQFAVLRKKTYAELLTKLLLLKKMELKTMYKSALKGSENNSNTEMAAIFNNCSNKGRNIEAEGVD